jgi:hypothetical protein
VNGTTRIRDKKTELTALIATKQMRKDMEIAGRDTRDKCLNIILFTTWFSPTEHIRVKVSS